MNRPLSEYMKGKGERPRKGPAADISAINMTPGDMEFAREIPDINSNVGRLQTHLTQGGIVRQRYADSIQVK